MTETKEARKKRKISNTDTTERTKIRFTFFLLFLQRQFYLLRNTGVDKFKPKQRRKRERNKEGQRMIKKKRNRTEKRERKDKVTRQLKKPFSVNYSQTISRGNVPNTNLSA